MRKQLVFPLVVLILCLACPSFFCSLSAETIRIEPPFLSGSGYAVPVQNANFGQEYRGVYDETFFDRLPRQDSFIVDRLPLADGRTVSVQLVPFSPWAFDGHIVVHDGIHARTMEPPRSNRYFRVYVAGEVKPSGFFRVSTGQISGFIDIEGHRHCYGLIAGDDHVPLMAVTRFDGNQNRENYQTCLNDFDQTVVDVPIADPRESSGSRRVPSEGTLRAEIAIDMDYEAYTFFGSVDNAVDYATDLMGAITIFYERDVDTIVAVKTVRVWTSTGGSYPYTGSTTSTLLGQIKSEYIANMGSVVRATAHLLSKKSLGGGIAYQTEGGVLCNNTWAYGVVGIHGTYSYPTSAYTWDADAFAHELGHNFGSRHTHCYQNLGSWLDCCYVESGCCPGPATSTRGTIMSYCHLQPAGKDLVFHSYVKPIIRQGAENGSCVLESGSPGTIVEDGTGSGLEVASLSGTLPIDVVHDDGGVESATGYSGNNKACWVVRFTPAYYPMTLTDADVLIWHSSVAVGRPIRLLVYLDPAGTGNPSSSTLTWTQDVTVQVVDTSSWNSYQLSTPVIVSSGDVYIGFYDYNDNDGVSTYIAAADTTTPANRSYLTANTTNPASLSLSTIYNFMIRGHGQRPATDADLVLSWGPPCNSLMEPYQKYAVYAGSLTSLPLDGYDPAPVHCAIDDSSLTLFNVTDNSYFTVVPIVGPLEGGHGFNRPAPSSTCGVISPDPSCP